VKLATFFSKIFNDKDFRKSLLAVNGGHSFELNILDKLKDGGTYSLYEAEDFKKLSNFKDIKKLIQNYNEDCFFIETNLLSELATSPKVVFQPFGKQNSPDLLFINENKVFILECKFTNSKIKAPV